MHNSEPCSGSGNLRDGTRERPYVRSRALTAASRSRAIVTVLILLIAAFALGRATARRPAAMVGKPVEMTSLVERIHSYAGGTDSNRARVTVDGGSVIPARIPGRADSVCGAPTRSGKPCRRRVRGGGYCWQHREKLGSKDRGGSVASNKS
jgi:hypothetical protein